MVATIGFMLTVVGIGGLILNWQRGIKQAGGAWDKNDDIPEAEL